MFLPIARERVDDLRQLLLHARVHALAHLRREVAPEIGVVALHDPLDRVAQLAARRLEDLLGDLLGLDLLVEVLGGADLGDPLVDRDRAHLRCARRHDPLPAEPAAHDPGDLLDLARHRPHDLRQARNLDAGELHRLEQHPDARPVRHVADRPREERDADHREDLSRAHPGRHARAAHA
jgi:hypothetical protein